MGTETTADDLSTDELRTDDAADDDERPPGSLGTRVCLALTEREDVHPWKSPPLYDVLDPGVLETLEDQENEEWRLEFQAGNHTVVVSGGGEVRVDGERFTDRAFEEEREDLDDDENGRQRLF